MHSIGLKKSLFHRGKKVRTHFSICVLSKFIVRIDKPCREPILIHYNIKKEIPILDVCTVKNINATENVNTPD